MRMFLGGFLPEARSRLELERERERRRRRKRSAQIVLGTSS